jgi:cellulose biosynthesis protein BcsQ
MSAPVLTLFNNKSGVGKTSLVYHLAWMFAALGKRVVVADMDPQANLTSAFLDEELMDALWNGPEPGTTIYRCVSPLATGGEIVRPALQSISSNICLLPGDISLSGFEDTLSSVWLESVGDRDLYRPMRIISAFWQVMQMAADEVQGDIVLVDTAPDFGAINRSVLIATDSVLIPLGTDLVSLQGLKSLGPTLRRWNALWQKWLDKWGESSECGKYPDFRLPQGRMQPLGYLCKQHGIRPDRPLQADDRWVRCIPEVYRRSVLDQLPERHEEDPYCLATIRHYRSLVPMAQEHRKPIFNLTSADGAIGSHASAVQDAKKEFRLLASRIAGLVGIPL